MKRKEDLRQDKEKRNRSTMKKTKRKQRGGVKGEGKVEAPKRKSNDGGSKEKVK